MAEENESEQSGTPGRPAVKLGVKKLTAIIVAAVAVALVGIGGGYAYWTHHEGNAYHEAVAQAENADKALMKAVDEATATTYKADQLKEPKLLDKLDDAIRKAKALKGVPNDAPSEWLAWQLASAKKDNATDADEADAQVKALNAALKAVRDSKLAKELDGAKDLLKQGIDGAGKTLKDTDGKVADNATRDSLKKAIDEANSTLSKKGVTDPKTYTDAKAKLDVAVKQVTDSKAAKEQADAEAAAQAQAQAAQAQAAAAAAQPQSSYAQSYNRYGGSGSGYSSNRGYSAPQQSYTPSNNGGGSYSGPTITGGGISNNTNGSGRPIGSEGLL
ncbi:colicin transporter [Bifidobacterium longum]|uniref:colicin transporter n=1 Tax=Bifidobacterium longum TaxID=216816 RepID=UPI0022496CF8|nr:colicin transporter [Bifidobacterium longum]MCX2910018.1 colicin transporter [Bifidobacterium longum]